MPARDGRRARHGADRDERRGGAAARPEPRHRGPPDQGAPARRGADRGRLRDPRARALAGRAAGDDGRRRARVLRDLLRVPQPQEHRPAAARRAVRPPPRGHRPQRVRRPRPGPGPPRPARDGRLRRVPVGHLRLVLRVRAGVGRAGARGPARPAPRAVLRDRALAQLGAGSRELLPAAVARAGVRAAGELRGSAVDRRQPPADGAAQPAHRLPARPGGRRRGPEHRRVRVAARLDLLHRRARDPPARRPAARVRGGLGADGAYRPGHALLRLALRARRRRRHAHRGHLARAGAGADRLRAARRPRARARPPPSPA